MRGQCGVGVAFAAAGGEDGGGGGDSSCVGEQLSAAVTSQNW